MSIIEEEELIQLIFSACEYVARNSYVGCDECIYQRFLEAELNARFRARFGGHAPIVQREVSMHQTFTASDGTPVSCPSPRTDLLVFGSVLNRCPDMILELKATSRVTSHMCFQANKYAHMMPSAKLVFLVDFVQPDNETLFAGPNTVPVITAPPPSSTAIETAPTTAPTSVRKRKHISAAPTMSSSPSPPPASFSDYLEIIHKEGKEDDLPPRPAAVPSFQLQTRVMPTNVVDPNGKAEVVPLQLGVRMDCNADSYGPGPGLFFLVGWPQDALSTTIAWRRYAKPSTLL